jgi:hypothetical protein
MIATYHGGTNGFTDSAGLFGGVSDNGSQSIAWTAAFTFDSDVNRQTSGMTDTAQGGLGAVFTMNGHSISIGGSGSAARNDGLWKFSNSQADGLYNLQVDFSYIFSGPAAPLLDQEFGQIFDNNSCGFATSIAAGVGGTLCASSITVARAPMDAAIVPEPASWALLIFGFGGVGAAMRQRRAVLARSIAAA